MITRTGNDQATPLIEFLIAVAPQLFVVASQKNAPRGALFISSNWIQYCDDFSRSNDVVSQVKAIQLHYFDPGDDKIVDEVFTCIVVGIDL